MEISQEQFDEAVLEITKDAQAWAIVKQGLSNEVFAVQAQAFDLQTWDQVVETRGFVKGLAYMINLRENTIFAMQQRQEDASV